MDFLTSPLFVTLVMLAWGIVVRYNPSLKDLPNRLIVWMNVAIGVLAKLLAPDVAEAAGFFPTLGAQLGWFIVPLQTIAARQLFETFVKPTLEHVGILGFPATPVAGDTTTHRKR
jgi:hypothetical protein